MKSPTVFISSDVGFAREVVPEGVACIAKSMILVQHLPFQLPDSLPPWLFFSSREAVRAFFAQVEGIHLPKLAAIGAGTAALLKTRGPVLFTGEGASTSDTAMAFARFSEPDGVLFPCAENSLRTVQQALPSERVADLVCYRTTEAPVTITGADLLVFTSPSNVRAYVLQNDFLPHQLMVAMGEATALELRRLGATRVEVAPRPSREALRDTIIKMLSGYSP